MTIRLKVGCESTVGPALLEDHIAREKIMRFDHERIPERVVHARGAGAHGYFKAYDSGAEQWTEARVLTDPSRTTPVFARFSTVQGSRGSAVNELNCYSLRFRTDDGARTLFGTSGALRSSSTPRRGIGISWGTIFQFSSSRMRSSFRISSMQSSPSLTTKCRPARARTTTFGTLSVSSQNVSATLG